MPKKNLLAVAATGWRSAEFAPTFPPLTSPALCQHSQRASPLKSLISLISPDFKHRRISYLYSDILRSLEQMEAIILLQMHPHVVYSKQLLCLLPPVVLIKPLRAHHSPHREPWRPSEWSRVPLI